MTILDTFYLLFKTDAPGAKQEITDLEKQIDSLTAKGKKRSEQETAALKELKKQHKELNDEYKEQQRQVDALGQSFVKTVESAVGAATAYLSFSALKSGVMDAQKLNSALQVQSTITGQSAGTMRAYGAAVEAAGGSQEAFFSSVNETFKAAAQAGQPLRDIDKYYHDINQQMQGLSKNEQSRRLGLLGIADPGMVVLLEKTSAEFEKTIEQQKKHAKATEESAAAAREFDRQWKQTSQTFGDVFSKIGQDILPGLTSLLKGLEDIGTWLTSHEHIAEAFFVTAAVGVSVLTAAIAGGLLGALGTLGTVSATVFGGIGTIAAAALTPVAALVALAAGAGGLIWKHQSVGNWVDKWWHSDEDKATHDRYQNSVKRRDESTVGNGSLQKESYDFWRGQGYSHEQASGIVANEARESSFRPGVVGDGGRARGAFQWHPDRQQKIKAGTGIDVGSASHMDQLRAAAWELQQRGDASHIKQATSAGEAAAIFSNRFESPANGTQEAIIRAQMAAKIANQMMGQSPITPPGPGRGGDKNLSVKIDEVNVHTQATDANGISREIGVELQNQIRNTISNFDDGVQS